jgi:hypothetical protein
MRRIKCVLFLIVVNAAVSSLTANSALATAGGTVLPATARPHGWSLDRMTGALAMFNTSGNNPSYYPNTPFQVLYVDPSTAQSVPVDGGLSTSGSNTFRVPPGTPYFVPLFFVDDSPPVLGTWPATHAEAIGYFFDASQYGAQGFEITVDGQTTPIGSAYLAGPVQTAPLLDGGGTHILTLGAFLHPLTPGRHTVSIAGGVFGDQLLSTYGIAFLTEADTYTVTVR